MTESRSDATAPVLPSPRRIRKNAARYLYDIDIFFKEFAGKQGMRLWRAESLNGSQILTSALEAVVQARL